MNFECIEKMKGAHLLVAGEVGIDEYVWGDTRRISPEAPVPVVEVDSVTHKLGLAANVAQNISSLGATVTLVSVRGEDADGDRLSGMLREAGLTRVKFVTDATRPTLRKVRVIAQKQHVVRVDYERVHGLEAKLARQFRDAICDSVPQCDGVILQDYAKGLWDDVTVSFIQHAKSHGRPVFVDPNRNTPLSRYRGVTLLTPNTAEAEALSGEANLPSKVAGKDDARLLRMGRKILDETGAEHAVITCGEWGMIAVSQGSQALSRIPTFARDVFDVTGAGDTVVAVLALMVVSGHSLPKAMQVANAAAGIVVGHIGAASVSSKELKEELERLHQVGLIKG